LVIDQSVVVQAGKSSGLPRSRFQCSASRGSEDAQHEKGDNFNINVKRNGLSVEFGDEGLSIEICFPLNITTNSPWGEPWNPGCNPAASIAACRYRD
jgi:hypothetical protein